MFGVMPVRPRNVLIFASIDSAKGMRWRVRSSRLLGAPEIVFRGVGAAFFLVILEVVTMGNCGAELLKKWLVYLGISRQKNHLMARVGEIMLDELRPVIGVKASKRGIYDNG